MAHDNGAPDATLAAPDGRNTACVQTAPRATLPATVRLDALIGHLLEPAPALDAAERSEGPLDLRPVRAPLAERIVALPPAKSMEAFRTKVKVKAASPSIGSADAAPHGDDLTRIRGIDAALAGRLATFGVSEFRQIATWEQADVQTISQTLDLGRTISRQNWIEQAALLVGPGSIRRPEAPTALATATAPAAPPQQQAPVVSAPDPTPVLVQLPPVVPVPVVPVPVVSFAVVAESAPAAPQLAWPRVVSVDSPGDAKFHRATVVVHASAMPDVDQPQTPSVGREPTGVPLPPVVPVPTVPEVPFMVTAPAIPVPEVPAPAASSAATMPAVEASSVDSALAAALVLAPFAVPVPVVPEIERAAPLKALNDATAEAAEAEAAPGTVVSTTGLPPTLTAPPVDTTDLAADALPPEDTVAEAAAAEDAVLETQLHAAVAGAADDRAVAATIDLLAAFSPPPIADDPGFPGAHPWPTSPWTTSGLPPKSGASAAGASMATTAPDLTETAADIAFTRWVPTTPQSWSPPVPREMAEFPAPPDHRQSPALRAAAQAVAASAAEAHSPAEWTRSRDRWNAADQVPPPPPAAPTTMPLPAASVPLPPAIPPVLPEPVEPTMLDRLASLEAELSALAANDQPRAHAAAAQTVIGAGPATIRSEFAAASPYQVPAALPPQPSLAPRAAIGRADMRMEPSQTLPEPSARGGLNGSEADVMIVPRGNEQVEIRSVERGPSLGTLEQRLRRARPTPEVDVDTYAGYHAAISEASVEIVRRDSHSRAVVFSDTADNSDESAAPGRENSVRKFFKALKGDAN